MSSHFHGHTSDIIITSILIPSLCTQRSSPPPDWLIQLHIPWSAFINLMSLSVLLIPPFVHQADNPNIFTSVFILLRLWVHQYNSASVSPYHRMLKKKHFWVLISFDISAVFYPVESMFLCWLPFSLDIHGIFYSIHLLPIPWLLLSSHVCKLSCFSSAVKC